MKILAAKFVLEANAHVPMKCDMENVALSYGKEALSHMQLVQCVWNSVGFLYVHGHLFL